MRKGQIALFVVIGLVLVIIIALFFLLHKAPDQELTGVNKEAFAPVNDLITSCTEASLERLVRKAGANGGYLDTSSLHYSPKTQESDLVSFPPQRVPYWSHLKPCNNILGCEATEQPPLCRQNSPCPLSLSWHSTAPSIQEQLEAALPGEVDRCLRDFDAVKEQFKVERVGEPSATITFGDGELIGRLHMPVKITDLNSGLSLRLEEFTARADVDLARVYTLAHQISDAERRSFFLERLTLHLISIYSGLNEPLPPMRAVTLIGQKHYWLRSNVEKVLRDEVLPWTSFIQVPNAVAGFTPIWPSNQSLSKFDQTMYAGIFQYLEAKVGDDLYPEMKARFFYPYTKPYVSINGGQELLKPRSADTGNFFQKILGIFMNDYRFRYDLSYPVIVTLTDDNAFGGKGYDFNFALETNIRRNNPINRSQAADAFSLVNEQVDMTTPLQRVRNTLNFRVTDKHTHEPLPYARINYACGQEYFVGETDAQGLLTTTLPYCRYGGVILYSKHGYLGSGVEYNNFERGITHSFDLSMWPLENVTLQVRKRTPEQVSRLMTTVPTEKTIRNESSPLNKSELVMFTLNRVKETPYDDDSPMVGFYSFSVEEQNLSQAVEEKRKQLDAMLAKDFLTQGQYDDWIAALKTQEAMAPLPKQPTVSVMLAPGKYEIEAYLIRNGKFTIPEEKRDFCLVGGGSLCIGKKSITLNETNFTSWLSGAAIINASNPYDLNENVLYRFSNYTFYVLEQKVPASWSELETYQEPETLLEGRRLLQLPTYE